MNFSDFKPAQLNLSPQSTIDYVMYMSELPVLSGPRRMKIDKDYTCRLSIDSLQVVHSFLYTTAETEMKQYAYDLMTEQRLRPIDKQMKTFTMCKNFEPWTRISIAVNLGRKQRGQLIAGKAG